MCTTVRNSDSRRKPQVILQDVKTTELDQNKCHSSQESSPLLQAVAQKNKDEVTIYEEFTKTTDSPSMWMREAESEVNLSRRLNETENTYIESNTPTSTRHNGTW